MATIQLHQPKKASSKVWKYFGLQKDDNGELNDKKAYCSLCSKSISYKWSTSNLLHHLQSVHYVNYEAMMKNDSKQKKITSCLDLPMDPTKQAQVTEQLVKHLICTDLQPLSIVENVGFRAFMKLMSPTYTIPSRSYITTNVLDSLYLSVIVNDLFFRQKVW